MCEGRGRQGWASSHSDLLEKAWGQTMKIQWSQAGHEPNQKCPFPQPWEMRSQEMVLGAHGDETEHL